VYARSELSSVQSLIKVYKQQSGETAVLRHKTGYYLTQRVYKRLSRRREY